MNKDEGQSVWKAIRLDILFNLKNIPVDLFFKFSEVKYLRVYMGKDFSLKEIVGKYRNKNVSEFYCRRQDYELFSTFLLSGRVEVNACEKVNIINEMISIFGVSEHVAKQIQQVTNESIGIIERDKNLAVYLRSMLDKGDALSQHSLMVSFVSVLLVKEMQWCSQSVLEKLSFAGILHDMLMTAPVIENINDPETELADFSWREQKIYGDHIAKLVILLEKSNHIPVGVIDIIVDHHKLTDDKLFPLIESGSSISQISALFILVDELCHSIQQGNNIDIEAFAQNWDSFYEHHNKGNFKNPLAALKRLILERKIG